MTKIGVLAFSTFLLALPVFAAKNSTPPKEKSAATLRSSWPSETLTGTIMSVEPDSRLVIVQGPSGVPFDMIVTPSTRIERGDRRLTLQSLASQADKGVSVRFIPERKGDVARSIEMKG